MDTILKFLMNNYLIFLIIFSVFLVMLAGYFSDTKMPKKNKNFLTEEQEMEKKIFELKNSPLAQTTLNGDKETDPIIGE